MDWSALGNQDVAGGSFAAAGDVSRAFLHSEVPAAIQLRLSLRAPPAQPVPHVIESATATRDGNTDDHVAHTDCRIVVAFGLYLAHGNLGNFQTGQKGNLDSV
jgi:hypothetical protein